MADIHVTEVSQWLGCRKHHHYSYTRQLVRVPEPRGARWFGRGMHYALARYYESRAPLVPAFDEWWDKKEAELDFGDVYVEERLELDRLKELAHGMLRYYERIAPPQDNGWVTETVERPFRVSIPGTEHTLVGTIDLLIRKRDDERLWVVDHKTYATFIRPEILDTDWQLSAYLWLVKQTYGETPGGAILNQLRKAVPTEPKLLKSGTLSRDKTINTDAHTYRQTILQYGQDPDQYIEHLTYLEQQENKFHQREFALRTDEAYESFERLLSTVTQEMYNPRTVVYPTFGMHCSMCEFRTPCKVEFMGGYAESIIHEQYKVVTERVL